MYLKGITRRDFLNTMLIGAGAALLELPGPSVLWAGTGSGVSAWDGYGASGDYAGSQGNTPEVVALMRRIREGAFAGAMADAVDTGETYDLVIVGGGLSGLGAAFEFKKLAPPGARCLILESHAIFGGTARRNEFVVKGKLLTGPQGSNAFSVINNPSAEGYEVYQSIGLPHDFSYAGRPNGSKPMDFDTTNYGYRLWFDSPNIGYRNSGGRKSKWASNPWFKRLRGTHYSGRTKRDLLKWRNAEGWDPEKEAPGARHLDSITYKEYLEDELRLSPEVTAFADPIMATTAGMGSDALSALTAKKVMMPGFGRDVRFGRLSEIDWHSFPGGNAGIARYLVRHLIPGALPGGTGLVDVIGGPLRLGALDREGEQVRLRLGAMALRVEQGKGPMVRVAYHQGGALRSLRARAVVMASGAHIARNIVAGLGQEHREAMDGLVHSPFMVVNVALNNWRFLHSLGFTACRWFDGFGYSCNIRKPMLLGGEHLAMGPEEPNLLTFYIPFHEPGLPVREQVRRGRERLLGTSFGEYEAMLLGKMDKLFGESGFDASRDVAGIVLNRWTHAFITAVPGFHYGMGGRPGPGEVLRRPIGKIAFGHSELRGHQHWVGAVEEGRRALRQVL